MVIYYYASGLTQDMQTIPMLREVLKSSKKREKNIKYYYMMLYDHAGGLTQNMQIIPMPRVVDGLQQRHQCIAVAALPKNIKHKKIFNPFSWTYTMVTPPR